LKQFLAKLKAWMARLVVWRKPAAAEVEAAAEPSNEPSNEPSAEAGAPPLGWLARLKQALRWRRKAIPQPQDQNQDPEQTVVVARPSREQLDAAETEAEPPPKLPWLARLKEKFRRQPKLEALEESVETDDFPASTRHSATRDENEEAEQEAPKPGLLKRLLAVLSKKWVWIPSVGMVVLALVGSVTFMLLNAAQEKEKLQAELKKARKQIAQQAAVVKQASVAKQAAALENSPEQAPRPAPVMVVAANSDTKPGVAAGDCLVTSKESVATSLKGCIESFNAKTGTRTAERKP